MLGAIVGDIIGSRHEFNPIKQTEFELFHTDCRYTDDTVCTVAVAEALLDDKPIEPTLAAWVTEHPYAGFAHHFFKWAMNPDRKPYESWGNGSAMRVSPAPWLAEDLGETVRLAAATAEITHNHFHGMVGAKATAVAIRMALEGWSKEEIRNVLTDRFGYDLSRRLGDIRPTYSFQASCQKSVPEALICFFEASSYEEAIRLCVSLGGDADTQAAIAGSVAEPFFGLPESFIKEGRGRLTKEMNAVVDRFRDRVDGRTYSKTDPGAIPVCRQPDPAESLPDAILDREMQKIAMLQGLAAAEPSEPQRFEWLRRAVGLFRGRAKSVP